MTTVAYRDGIIAADTGMCIGDARLGETRKIASHGGVLAGGAGSAGFVEKFLAWVEGGQKGDPPDAKEDDDAIDRGMIINFGSLTTVHVLEPTGWMQVQAKYYALGSGREVALGAMWKGASAEEAVRAGIDHDVYTWGRVQQFSVGG